MTILDEFDAQVRQAEQLLPAWFIPRMMCDEWSFGLLLTSGVVLAITHISAVRQGVNGTVWLDVDMAPSTDRLLPISSALQDDLPIRIVGAPTTRLAASVNAAHVIWAFELADT